MSRDYVSPEERSADALERIADALERIAGGDVQQQMKPGTWWRACYPDGRLRIMSEKEQQVREWVADEQDEGLRIERQWVHTAHEWRPEL